MGEQLAAVVRQLRLRAGLTQEELAEHSGLSVRTIRGLETSHRCNPRLVSVRQLAQALDLRPGEHEELMSAALATRASSTPPQAGTGTGLGEVPRKPTAVPGQLVGPTAGTASVSDVSDGTAEHSAVVAVTPIGAPAPAVPGWPGPGVQPPRQLPPGSARFTGRDTELARLDALLPGCVPSDGASAAEPTVVSIDGPAGIGKTALAVRWAHRISGRYPDGQVFIDLHGYSPGQPVGPATALGRFLRTLGMSPGSIPADLDDRSALWRTQLAGRLMILVLDNARSAEQVRPLLPGSNCLVIVTSRNQLRGLASRDSAHRITVRPLPPSDAVALLSTALGADRVTAEYGAVADLAELCGRFPLAVLVAGELASRHPDVPLPDLVRQLRDVSARLDALCDPDDQQADLRAAFSWSYQALNRETATVFRHLGLLPAGDFDLPAVAALAGIPAGRAARLLDRLVAANLLHQRHPHSYELHDLVYAYAADLAKRHDTEAEQAEVIHRILDWYLYTAAEARQWFRPHPRLRDVADPADCRVAPLEFDDFRAARDWCDAEQDRLLSVVRYAAGSGWHTHAWKMAWLMSPLFEVCGQKDARIAAASMGRYSALRLGDPQAIQYMGITLAFAYLEDWRPADALAPLQETLETCRSAGDRSMESVILDRLGGVHRHLGEFEKAIGYGERAVAMDRESGVANVSTLMNLGINYLMAGQFEPGMRYTREALAVSRETGDRFSEAKILCNLAEAHQDTGDFETAMTYAEQALPLSKEMNGPHTTADIYLTIGRIKSATGRPEEARKIWQEARELLTQSKHPLKAKAEDLLESLDKR